MSLSVSDVDFGEQNIIYVSAPEKERSYGVEWTAPATESLICYLKRYLDLFIAGKLKTKKQIYENISAAMEEQGMFYSSAQCENKWKSLKRTYISRYEKGNNSTKRVSFVIPPYESEVEDILKLERPSFKKELELNYDLNVPPGFTKVEPESASEEEPEYTEKDEELVQMVLREPHSAGGSKGRISVKSFGSNQPSSDNEEHSYYLNNVENSDSIGLVDEVIELRKVVKKNLSANTEVLKHHNATHEQLLTYLDSLDKREEEKMEIKRRKLDKQDDIIQQLKIQNSLIAKLIQQLNKAH